MTFDQENMIDVVSPIINRERISPNGFEDWRDNLAEWQRHGLKHTSEEIYVSLEWLKACRLSAKVNRNETSYGLKHQVEYATGVYVCNGAFLIAAYLAPGVTVEKSPWREDGKCSLNGFLNIATKGRPPAIPPYGRALLASARARHASVG